MAKNSSSMFGTVIISVFLTLIIIGAGGYFGLPLLYPNLTADLNQYETSDEGIILQRINVESKTYAYIFDYDTGDYQTIPEMNVNISISTNSKISATFSAIAFLTLGTGFQNHTIFSFRISVVGIKERTGTVRYFEQDALSAYRQISQFIYLNLITESLSAGTYQIIVEWRSDWDPSGTNSLSLGHSSTFNHSRSLVVEEFK
ncbi:MAG: hypothetical protein K9W44_01115 [Candidatus Lokiarchaeota archaeon]|nr:hypothetical protein [Candidatus Harpocratesius repetitus]